MRPALLAAAVLALAGCGGGGGGTTTVTQTVTHVKTVTVHAATTSTVAAPATNPCAAGSLTGTFDGIPGSAGAGQIVYKLTVTNTGSSPCFVSGIPEVQLLGTTGKALPTSATAAQPGIATAAKVSLKHGASATADAQFSPDVNGTGDSTTGQCQPTATVLRVTAPGGGTFDVPIQPPTAVCEQGSLHFKGFTAS